MGSEGSSILVAATVFVPSTCQKQLKSSIVSFVITLQVLLRLVLQLNEALNLGLGSQPLIVVY